MAHDTRWSPEVGVAFEEYLAIAIRRLRRIQASARDESPGLLVARLAEAHDVTGELIAQCREFLLVPAALEDE